MNYLENMKKIKQIIGWIFIVLYIGLTPHVFHLADLERGYTNGVGGEIFFPFIPLIVWMIKNSIKDIKQTVKGVMENE